MTDELIPLRVTTELQQLSCRSQLGLFALLLDRESHFLLLKILTLTICVS